MLLVLALGWLSSAQAAPDAPVAPAAPASAVPLPVDPCRAAPPDPTAPFAIELDRAKGLYRQGCHLFALELLKSLDVRRQVENIDSNDEIDARIYLGEVQFVLGRRDAARATFESLLTVQPDTGISVLEHDPDVVELFNLVRASTQAPAQRPEIRIPRRPLRSALPFGVAHHMNGDHGRAWAWTSAEVALIGTTVATWMVVDRLAPDRKAQPGAPLARARAWTTTNRLAGGALVGVYIASQLDARQHYRSSVREAGGVTVVPTGTGLRVSGTF